MKTAKLYSQFRHYTPFKWITLIALVCTIANCTKDSEPIIGEKSADLSKILLVKLNTIEGFSRPCSKKFYFEAEIKADGPMTLTYTWLHSDGTTVPEATLIFEEAGTKTVTTSWTFRESGNSDESNWKQLKIIAPRELLSNKAEFNLYCDAENRVEIISANPASPASLYLSDWVEFTYSYKTNEPSGVRIFGIPITGGSPTPGYSAHGSQIHPAGDGTGSGYFTLGNAAYHVEQIRFQMWDADKTNLLSESYVDVYYNYLNHRFMTDTTGPNSPQQ